MAIASLRRGAIRKEMPPHCVQQSGAWPQPQEAGHGNNILHSTSDTGQGTGLGSKGHVPAIREAFKDVVRVQKLGEHGLAGLRDGSTSSISSSMAHDWRGGSLMMPRCLDVLIPSS